jgi:hypothetical protein
MSHFAWTLDLKGGKGLVTIDIRFGDSIGNASLLMGRWAAQGEAVCNATETSPGEPSPAGFWGMDAKPDGVDRVGR